MTTDDDRDGSPGRRRLPDGLVPGRRTPEFTADTVPPALLRDHRTTVWARLEVSAGTVEFVDGGGDDDAAGGSVIASPGRPVVIVPERPHRVAPADGASFAVQFFDEVGD